jgi:hypothetical protein
MTESEKTPRRPRKKTRCVPAAATATASRSFGSCDDLAPRRDGPMRAVAAFEFRSRGRTLFAMRECNDHLKKSLDRNTTGRSAWTLLALQLHRAAA